MENLHEQINDIEELLEKRKAHLEQVKESILEAQEALPIIQQNIDVTDWHIRMLKNRPPEATEVPFPVKKDQIEMENQYLAGLFTVVNVPTGPELSLSTAVVTSGSSGGYTYVAQVRDLKTQSAIEFGNMYIAEYHHLQEIQERRKQVRALLEKLDNVNTLKRFDDASDAYEAYRSGAAKRTTAANEMRNLLNGVKGDLFTLARTHEKENMTWERMSARLVINGEGGSEQVLLIQQDRIHVSLLSRLADVLKDREGGSIIDLGSIWAEILDHLYTVLGLIG